MQCIIFRKVSHIVQLYTIVFHLVKLYRILPTRPSIHHSDISPCKSCDLRSAANKSKSQAKMSKHKVKQCSLLEGKFTSVLNTDFVVATETKGFNQRDVLLPFILKQLPTNEETLKLFLYLRHEVGLKNRSIDRKDLIKTVSDSIQAYWKMAHLPTITRNNIQFRIEKLITEYLKLMKDVNRQSQKNIEDRKKFEERSKSLFDIASKEIFREVTTDRFRRSLNIVDEVLKFYEDQKTERKMIIGALDEEYFLR